MLFVAVFATLAAALNSPSSGVPASEAGAPALQLLQLSSADQQQQHGAGQVANLSTQVPASPSRIAKRLREELADGAHSHAHSQAKRRLLQQELQVQELDAQQTELEWQLVQEGVANSESHALLIDVLLRVIRACVRACACVRAWCGGLHLQVRHVWQAKAQWAGVH